MHIYLRTFTLAHTRTPRRTDHGLARGLPGERWRAVPVAAAAAESRDDGSSAVKHFIRRIPGGAHETRDNHAISL